MAQEKEQKLMLYEIFDEVALVGVMELKFGKEDDWNNPVKASMLMISFGSGMSTVYFRTMYGVVTNRLTGNIYRLARGFQDLAHGEDKCPNARLTGGICMFFVAGLMTFYSDMSRIMGLFLPVSLLVAWEIIETIYETCTDGDPPSESESESEYADQLTPVQYRDWSWSKDEEHKDEPSHPDVKSVKFQKETEIKFLQRELGYKSSAKQSRLDYDFVNNLRMLHLLKQQGALSEEEFQQAKKKLLFYSDPDVGGISLDG